MLAADGHTVVHLTRHCAMEMGKDVLSVAPDGVPCAYQLKGAPGGKINLTRWRKEIEPQAFGLVTGGIVHPSIPSVAPHRAYFVTNGELEEEVIRAIVDMNAGFVARGQPELSLRTIVRGELLMKARSLETNLWPADLPNVKAILEMYLETGDGPLPKRRLAKLLEQIILPTNKEHEPTREELNRAIASAGVFCSLAIASFSLKENLWAEIEAWTLYAGYVLNAAYRYSLPQRIWQPQFEIAERQLYKLLVRLAEHLATRTQFTEGDLLFDSAAAIQGVRITLLIGLLSVLALWPASPEGDERSTDFLWEFCQRHRKLMFTWGEGAIPCWLGLIWHQRRHDATAAPDFLLRELIGLLTTCNHPRNPNALATPYYSPDEILENALGLKDAEIKDAFSGRSYMLEGLVHLFAKRNWKQSMRALWPDVSRIRLIRFHPQHAADFFRWRCTEGVTRDIEPQHSQAWGELVTAASDTDGKCLPEQSRTYPAFILLYLIVCPHRSNAEVLRWLDSRFVE
jgi:hypothetical protein